MSELKDDIAFLLAFAPATDPKQVEEGLMGMYYVTGTFAGDVALAERAQKIVERYGIDVNTIEDIIEDFE